MVFLLKVFSWAQAMPKFASDLMNYVQTFLERTYERCRTSYMEVGTFSYLIYPHISLFPCHFLGFCVAFIFKSSLYGFICFSLFKIFLLIIYCYCCLLCKDARCEVSLPLFFFILQEIRIIRKVRELFNSTFCLASYLF